MYVCIYIYIYIYITYEHPGPLSPRGRQSEVRTQCCRTPARIMPCHIRARANHNVRHRRFKSSSTNVYLQAYTYAMPHTRTRVGFKSSS